MFCFFSQGLQGSSAAGNGPAIGTDHKYANRRHQANPGQRRFTITGDYKSVALPVLHPSQAFSAEHSYTLTNLKVILYMSEVKDSRRVSWCFLNCNFISHSRLALCTRSWSGPRIDMGCQSGPRRSTFSTKELVSSRPLLTIQKNFREPYFIRGVFCAVTHSRVSEVL